MITNIPMALEDAYDEGQADAERDYRPDPSFGFKNSHNGPDYAECLQGAYDDGYADTKMLVNA